MMAAPMSRRRFLAGAAGGAAAVAAAGAVTGCTGGGRRSGRAVLPAGGPAPGRPIVVGCVTPMTGPYAAIGQIVAVGLRAATRHIATDLGGSLDGYTPRIVMADAPLTPADGQQAYASLAAQGCDAILWCGSPGLVESLPQIVANLTPVIAVGTDLQNGAPANPEVPNLSTSDGAGFPVFQTSISDASALDAILDYAAHNRGFTKAALLSSMIAAPNAANSFQSACNTYGIVNVGTTPFDTSAGPPDLTAAIAALRTSGAEAVVVLGAAPDAAAAAAALDAAGARYVDTPAAKQRGFAPMLMGSPAATASSLFARLAGAHAATGTIGASTLGAVVGLPDAPLRSWIKRFVVGYNGGIPQGGEDGPADALAAVLMAAATAESTNGADIVAGLESGFTVQFATPSGFRFGPGQHLSAIAGDVCLQTLERSPEPTYDLGADWGAVFPRGYRTPDLLVDPTLAANRLAQPDLMARVVALRYGISSQAAYQGGDQAKMRACAAVH